jgi:hypothetical protein
LSPLRHIGLSLPVKVRVDRSVELELTRHKQLLRTGLVAAGEEHQLLDQLADRHSFAGRLSLEALHG